MTRLRTVLVAAAGTVVAVLLAACTASHPAPGGTTTTTRTETETVGSRPPSTAAFTPAAPATVAPLGNRTSAPRGERFGRCPYIANGAGAAGGQVPGNNVANLEGNRVGRSTVLTSLTPVGCRFYFAYSYGDMNHYAVAEIRPQTLANAATARNAMILTARTGTELAVQRDFADGLTGISFRTRFFGPDGPRDWAFVFAKGNRIVTVYTEQKDVSYNAKAIAQQIAPRF